jgi:hypothetical protein
VIRVLDAGGADERLRCEGCGEVVHMTRADPKRWAWVHKHVRCEKARKDEPKEGEG